jgi:hypothetical protein
MKTLNKKTLSKLSVTEMKCVRGGDDGKPTYYNEDHDTASSQSYPCGDTMTYTYTDKTNKLVNICCLRAKKCLEF